MILINSKYKVGDAVLIYENGKLVYKSVKAIRVLITENNQTISYQLEGHVLLFDRFINEDEIFSSKEEFISIISANENSKTC